MEPRSRETTPSKEDLDSENIPDEKYLVSGKEFLLELQRLRINKEN